MSIGRFGQYMLRIASFDGVSFIRKIDGRES